MKKRMLMITYYRFPCEEPVLENIFAKELGNVIDITWILFGNMKKISNIKWHNSRIVILKSTGKKSFYYYLLDKIYSIYRYIYLLEILINKNINIIFVRDMPYWVCILKITQRIFGYKLYYQCTGMQGDLDIDYSNIIMGLRGKLYFILGKVRKILDRIALKKADLVFSITEYHRTVLGSFINVKKVIPLTMGADKEWSDREIERIDILEKYKKDFLLIGYFGSLSLLRNPILIMKVFEKLYKTNLKKCKMLLIGEIPSKKERKIIYEFIKDNNLDENIMHIDKLMKGELINYLRYCDITLSLIPPTEYYKISSPTKLYESLILGIAVVANREIYEQEKVIRESGGGLLCDYNIDSIKEAIVKMIQDRNKRYLMGKMGKEYVLQKYEYRKMARDILKYFY